MVYERLCYHGTSSRDGRSILRNREFKVHPFENQYLGEGVYFFEENPDPLLNGVELLNGKLF